MDMLLAMSFISGPMDFSGPSWVRTRMPSGPPSTRTPPPPPPPADQGKKDARTGHADRGCDASTGGAKAEGSKAKPPHLAPEFDGLHCFETFVIN